MTDFLLELLSEEIPARMQEKACADLRRLFEGELVKAGLKPAAVETYATPRRLALIARDLPAATEAVSEETKGPRAGAPPQALEGFLRKTGLTADRLTERDGVLFAIVERPGRATAEVLAEAIPAVIRAFPWPKSMRWGAASASTASLRWVRPLQGIVALFGEMIVPFEVEGLASGATTVGHRFHHPGPITIGSAADYAEKLRMCHVIVDAAERRGIIESAARALAEARGLRLIADEGLVAENAGLTEWPVPLLGDFDAAFLEVPREVIQLTLRTNQKYFVLADAEGRLAPNFICTANIDATDGGAAIVAGNRKVLAARLSDARFFWEQDLKVPLEEQAKKLSQIVFHEKLGTLADKVERVAKLARWLVEEGIVGASSTTVIPAKAGIHNPDVDNSAATAATMDSRIRGNDDASAESASLAALAETAARLCKADLVTGMVGEFPELQGVMGGYYARAEGLDPQIADAIRDHYKPVGQGDDVPTAPVTVAVSLADKLDTLIAFFAINQKPTGSKDPFALRRAAIAVNSLVLVNALRLNLMRISMISTQYFVSLFVNRAVVALEVEKSNVALIKLFTDDVVEYKSSDDLIRTALENIPQLSDVEQRSVAKTLKDLAENLKSGQHYADILDFFAERLKVQQREAGVRHDLIDAVFALGGEDDLVRLLARVKALQAFVGTEDGVNLLAGYKRASNILKKEGFDLSAPGVIPAQAGIHTHGVDDPTAPAAPMDSRLRGNDDGYAPEPAETALRTALDAAEPTAEAAVAAEDFAAAMAALATLRAPIDAFFESVTVNDPDPAKRASRLALLARIRAAVHKVADFSKIEG